MRLIGIIGWKNTGKTGLVTRLVAHFSAQGLQISTLKRTHHAVDLDQPGTDSHAHRMAGASQVMLASDRRYAIMQEIPRPMTVQDLAAHLDPVDLVIAEGWKTGTHPRIEAYRRDCNQPPIAATDQTVRAVVSDAAPSVHCPILVPNDIAAVADFIAAEVDL